MLRHPSFADNTVTNGFVCPSVPFERMLELIERDLGLNEVSGASEVPENSSNSQNSFEAEEELETGVATETGELDSDI